MGEIYNRSKHFDAAWVNTVILSMCVFLSFPSTLFVYSVGRDYLLINNRLSILESPNNLLLHPNLREGWFDCNPWAFVIDHCLLGLDAVLVQRFLPLPLKPYSSHLLLAASPLTAP